MPELLWRGRYADLTECMHGISLEELIMAVRRQSQGFSRGTSTFRGVTHHPSGCPSASHCTTHQIALQCLGTDTTLISDVDTVFMLMDGMPYLWICIWMRLHN